MRIDCFPCVRVRQPIGLYDRAAPAGESVVAKFMRRVYAPILLKTEVKQFVVAAFGGLLLVAIIGIQHIKLGLGQYLFSLLLDSKLIDMCRSTLGTTFRFVLGSILQLARSVP